MSVTTKRVLAMRSGNRCAKPDCNALLTEPGTQFDEAVVTGQVAHIVSQADDGPRADKDMPLVERDAEPNLVLLCSEHHIVADRQERTYTVQEMHRWKREHEALVEAQMEAAAPNITFLELELAADAVAAEPVHATPGFAVTAIRPKMDKNELTDRVTPDMARGAIGAPVVSSYLAKRQITDPRFPDRLRGGFVVEMERLKAEGLAGDDLFFALRTFAAPPHASVDRQVAGVAVLVHFFTICQMFEP